MTSTSLQMLRQNAKELTDTDTNIRFPAGERPRSAKPFIVCVIQIRYSSQSLSVPTNNTEKC